MKFLHEPRVFPKVRLGTALDKNEGAGMTLDEGEGWERGYAGWSDLRPA
jgi:hypothetical protein